ncbi:MAG TPA: aminoglycoside adenylyltransferase domain-containing protein [Pyrinomonadaceae bacterium]|jgi:predicted nucleotidyltransferase
MNETNALAEYTNIRELLDDILARLKKILGEKLVGLYVYGSLVAGDFDFEISDVDLLAATASVIDEQEFAALERMHKQIIEENPFWDNRIETAYVSLDALKTFKTKKSTIANTSPGEPLHFLEAGGDWLLNWYFVREMGVTLFGAPPANIIAQISKAEFVEAVREQVLERAENVEGARFSRPYQAYLIMTVCRALYSFETGEQTSKRRAASWTKKRFPGYVDLIENAFEWRRRHRDKNVNHEATFAEARDFILFIVEQIKGSDK